MDDHGRAEYGCCGRMDRLSPCRSSFPAGCQPVMLESDELPRAMRRQGSRRTARSLRRPPLARRRQPAAVRRGSRDGYSPGCTVKLTTSLSSGRSRRFLRGRGTRKFGLLVSSPLLLNAWAVVQQLTAGTGMPTNWGWPGPCTAVVRQHGRCRRPPPSPTSRRGRPTRNPAAGGCAGGSGDRRHHHQADRHLDGDQVVVLLSARDFAGQGEQLRHRERFLFQARPGGDAVPGHVSGRRLLFQDGERVPDRAVQARPACGVVPLRVVEQDQVQLLAPELFAVAEDLRAHVLRGEAVPGGGLVTGENAAFIGVLFIGPREPAESLWSPSSGTCAPLAPPHERREPAVALTAVVAAPGLAAAESRRTEPPPKTARQNQPVIAERPSSSGRVCRSCSVRAASSSLRQEVTVGRRRSRARRSRSVMPPQIPCSIRLSRA